MKNSVSSKLVVALLLMQTFNAEAATTKRAQILRCEALLRVSEAGVQQALKQRATVGGTTGSTTSVLGQQDPAKVVLLSNAPAIPSNRGLLPKIKLQFQAIADAIEQQYSGLRAKALLVTGPDGSAFNWTTIRKSMSVRAKSLKTMRDAYFFFADLFYYLKDAHVEFTLPSTLRYSLPIFFDAVDNDQMPIAVRWVSDSFPKGQQKPALKDVLISINGKTPEDFMSQFSIFGARGNPSTNRVLFANNIGAMSEASGIDLSKLGDSVSLTLQPQGGKPYTINLNWTKSGVGFVDKSLTDPSLTTAEAAVGSGPQVKVAAHVSDRMPMMTQHQPRTASILNRINSISKAVAANHIRDVYAKNHSKSKNDGSFPGPNSPKEKPNRADEEPGTGRRVAVGEQAPNYALMPGFQRIQVDAPKGHPEIAALFNDNFFLAGTYMWKGKKRGYLRIPSYEPDNQDTMFQSLRYFIGRLNAENCEMVFIDQTDNPGGLVIFSDYVIKSLAGNYDPSKHMTFQVIPTQSFLQEYGGILNDIQENADGLLTDAEVAQYTKLITVEYQKILKAYAINQAGSATPTFTEPLSMLAMSMYTELVTDRSAAKNTAPQLKAAYKQMFDGIDVTTHQTLNTKSAMWINLRNWSGADATPTNYQNYGIGPLIGGKSTAGAGAIVVDQAFNSVLELDYRTTGGLMTQPNMSLVENNPPRANIYVPGSLDDLETDTYAVRLNAGYDEANGIHSN